MHLCSFDMRCGAGDLNASSSIDILVPGPMRRHALPQIVELTGGKFVALVAQVDCRTCFCLQIHFPTQRTRLRRVVLFIKITRRVNAVALMLFAVGHLDVLYIVT